MQSVTANCWPAAASRPADRSSVTPSQRRHFLHSVIFRWKSLRSHYIPIYQNFLPILTSFATLFFTVAWIGEATIAIAILRLADRIFALSGDYFFAAKSARQEIRHIRNGVTTLHDVFEAVVELSNAPDETRSKGLRKLKIRCLLVQCATELDILIRKPKDKDTMGEYGLRVWRSLTSSKSAD